LELDLIFRGIIVLKENMNGFKNNKLVCGFAIYT
jgi:hypothetical protein